MLLFHGPLLDGRPRQARSTALPENGRISSLQEHDQDTDASSENTGWLPETVRSQRLDTLLIAVGFFSLPHAERGAAALA